MRPNGSDLVDLTADLGPRQYAGQPDFSPSGKSIALTLSGQRTTIFVMRADGGHLDIGRLRGGSPAWAPSPQIP